ncbi:MAG: hypothetical protein PVJ39_04105 [Gammaproteobacteria bacterium]
MTCAGPGLYLHCYMRQWTVRQQCISGCDLTGHSGLVSEELSLVDMIVTVWG